MQQGPVGPQPKDPVKLARELVDDIDRYTVPRASRAPLSQKPVVESPVWKGPTSLSATEQAKHQAPPTGHGLGAQAVHTPVSPLWSASAENLVPDQTALDQELMSIQENRNSHVQGPRHQVHGGSPEVHDSHVHEPVELVEHEPPGRREVTHGHAEPLPKDPAMLGP